MGTRGLVTVIDGNKEILCLYRQYDCYPEGMGQDLLDLFKGFVITNGISGDATKTANGMGCFAAQLVTALKREDKQTTYKSGGGAQVGNVYLYAPETREVGEEFVYTLRSKPHPTKMGSEKLWLDIFEGEVAYFGMPSPTPPEGMTHLYAGWLDNLKPKKVTGEHH